MFIVYLVFNTVTGKYYIGWTGYSFESRWYSHCNDARKGSNLLFHRAIRKYGPQAFVHCVLCVVSTEVEAKQLETLWILTLRSYDSEVGYNMTLGGDGVSSVSWTEEMRARVGRSVSSWFHSLTDEGLREYSKKLSKGQLTRYESMRKEEKELAAKQLRENYKIWLVSEERKVLHKKRHDNPIHTPLSEEEKRAINEKRKISNRVTWSSEELRIQHSKTMLDVWGSKSAEQRLQHGQAVSASYLNRDKSSLREQRQKLSDCWNGKILITDGKVSKWFDPKNPLPEGWTVGRHCKGFVWITNGLVSKRTQPDDPVPEGWRRGKTNKFKKREDTESLCQH
jgi:group I intron endonuclease